jgi:hypothetical protein
MVLRIVKFLDIGTDLLHHLFRLGGLQFNV